MARRSARAPRRDDAGRDAATDALWGLPLGEFTRARDALAARLRQAGEAEGAARVRRLRKPTPAVWAVNQLARRDGAALERLLGAVERLRAAQAAGSAEALAEAADAQRRALRELRDAARQRLGDAGFAGTAPMLERVTGTLLGAASRPDTAEDLRRGRLAREVERPGFEALAGAGERRPAGRPARARRGGERRDDPRLERAREADRVARSEATAASDRAEALERAAAEHRRSADEAARAAAQAERAAAAARREADAAARRAARTAQALRARR